LLRGRRRAIEPAEAERWSYAMRDHGLDALAPRAHVVAAYWPLPGEADPRPLARALARRVRARLALPVVDGEHLRFREWADDASLEPAGFGTYGPCATAQKLVPTIVLAPMLGFDATGARLGQGKGYYDRKLAELAAARPFVVGVAFACQQLPVVPTAAHDRPLDAILTERGLMTPRASA
jgi:5-formyltetrahydrofolate cyclo-ligase